MPVLGAAILLAALCFIKPPGGSPADVPIHRSDFLLNTFVDIAIYDSRDESILDGAMASAGNTKTVSAALCPEARCTG
mgnify:CR=1 FL=1